MEVLAAAGMVFDMKARPGPLTARHRGDPRIWGICSVSANGGGVGSQRRYLMLRNVRCSVAMQEFQLLVTPLRHGSWAGPGSRIGECERLEPAYKLWNLGKGLHVRRSPGSARAGVLRQQRPGSIA